MSKIVTIILFTMCVSTALFAQEKIPGQNPIIRDVFTADPAVLVYQDTMFLYVGHDVATGDEMFNIPEWLVYSSADMKSWEYHGVAMKGADFAWGGGNSWASQVIEKDGKFWFYTTTNHAENGKDAIGVAVADSPLGPFTDAKGEALVVDSMTPTPGDPNDWDDIDPTAYTDEEGTTWLSWGNLHLYLAKLKPNMIEIDGEIQELYLPNFTEGPWLHKKGELFYLSYACFAHQAMWEKLCYATAPKITGPWEYRGIIMDRTENSYTIHPAITEFKGQDYLFYHTGKLTIGDETGAIGRRAVSVDYLYYNEDGTLQFTEKTMEGLSVPPEKKEEFKPPVFNLNAELTEVESDFLITQKHGTAVNEWPENPQITSSSSPYEHAIRSESFNGQETGRNNAETLAQTFKADEEMLLSRIILYAGDGFGISSENSVKVSVYEVESSTENNTYSKGNSLLDPEYNWILNYHPQSRGWYELEIPDELRPTLKAGNQYVLELQGIRGSAPLFWYRSSNDMYPNGHAFKDGRVIREQNQMSDFLFAIYGE